MRSISHKPPSPRKSWRDQLSVSDRAIFDGHTTSEARELVRRENRRKEASRALVRAAQGRRF